MSWLWEEIHGNPSDQSQGAFSAKNIYLQCWGEGNKISKQHGPAKQRQMMQAVLQ